MSARRALETAIVFLVGLVIGPLFPLWPASSPASTSLDRMNLATATSFYAAANHLLESADDAPLLQTLDSTFVDHSPLGSEPTAAGLVRYLASLRATYPDLRLEAEAIGTRNEVVTFSLVATPATTAVVDGQVADWDGSAPGIERLSIRNGKVTERWASEILPPQVEQVSSINLLQPAGWFVTSAIGRLELETGASMTRRDASPSLLIVSAGTLSIEVARDGESDLQVLMEQGETDDSVLKRGASVELGRESVALVPQAQGYRIWNDQQETLIVIRVEFAFRASSTTFVNGDVNQVESTKGVTVNALAETLPPDINDDRPYRLRLVQVTAAPNETLPVHSVSGIEQMVVTRGALEAVVYAGSVWVLEQGGGRSEPLEDSRELTTDGVLTAHSEALLSYQVTSAEPATVWFVSIIPSPELAP